MKKLLILCFLFQLSASAIAQKLVFNNITVNLPKNAVAIKGTEIASRTASKSKKGSEIDPKLANLYSINGQVVGIWNNESGPGEERSLERVRSEGLTLYKNYSHATVYSSDIRMIGNNRFLIHNYENGGDYYIRFYSEDVKNNTVSGIIQYRKEDSKKAMTTIEQVLRGVTLNR